MIFISLVSASGIIQFSDTYAQNFNDNRQNDSLSVDDYVYKGMDTADLGNFSGALEYYDKALKLDGNDFFALDNKKIAISILSLIKETNNQQSLGTFGSTSDSNNGDLKLGARLIDDRNIYSSFENAYRVDDITGIYVNTSNNKLNSQVYHLASSPKNSVQNFDTQIDVDMTLKIPVFPNSTLESIEKIDGSYDVRYLDTQPDHTKLVAYSNSTINFNNTYYSNLTVELKKYFNGTTYLLIEGIRQ